MKGRGIELSVEPLDDSSIERVPDHLVSGYLGTKEKTRESHNRLKWPREAREMQKGTAFSRAFWSLGD